MTELTKKIDKNTATDPTKKLEEKMSQQRYSHINKFKLEEVSEDDIKVIIQELKPKKSCGKDGMSAELLKLGSEALIPPLTKIINKSIRSETFPTYWKEAIVKPLWKHQGEKEEMSNY